MHTFGQDPSGCANRTHLIQGTAVNALAILHDLLTHQLLGEGLEMIGQGFAVGIHCGAHRIIFFEPLDGLSGGCADGVEFVVALALGLLELLEYLADGLGAVLFQVGGQSGILLRGGWKDLLDSRILEDRLLRFDQFADGFIAEIDRFDHVLFRKLVGAGFHHHDAVRCAGNDQIEITALDLAVTGIEYKVVA